MLKQHNPDHRWQLLSNTAAYAIRAVVSIARSGRNDAMSVPDIARELKVPRNYLSKVLWVLAREGILESARGVGGGFRLVRSAETTYLAEIVAPFGGFASDQHCLLIQGRACSADAPCIAHTGWSDIAREIRIYFRETSIAALLRSDGIR